MNIFVTIKHINAYYRVNYYSICYEGEEESIFEKFINAYNDSDVHDELIDILEWMQRIGDDIGAQSRYFRHERAAHALPPPYRTYTSYVEGEPGMLRLYCMVINPSIVILYDGGIKTTGKASDCPNVSKHFKLANRITKAIDQAILRKDITLNDNDDDIVFDSSLELMINY